MEEPFPDEISKHYDREIDEAQRITQGLRQLELLRTREIVRRRPASPAPTASSSPPPSPGSRHCSMVLPVSSGS
jgi:hypothetical protein